MRIIYDIIIIIFIVCVNIPTFNVFSTKSIRAIIDINSLHTHTHTHTITVGIIGVIIEYRHAYIIRM